MKDLFYYQTLVKRKVKNEDGVEIEVEDVYWDFFHLSEVVRGRWVSPEKFIVILKDGHEQADDIQKPIFKNGKISGVETKRERAWFVSQIELIKEDVERLRLIAERL